MKNFCIIILLLHLGRECRASVFGRNVNFSFSPLQRHRETLTSIKSNGNDPIKKILQYRGGDLQLEDPLMYFKVGLLNLSKRRGALLGSSDEYSIESDEDSTMTTVITQWIQRQLSEKDYIKDNQSHIGNIVILSSEYRSNKFDDLMFHSNDEGDDLKDLGNMAETIGCLSNIIVVLYDTSNQYRQKAIVRMIKGIERQKKSSDFYKSVDIIILAVDENAEKELNVIRNVLKDGNEDIYQSLQILPLTTDPQIIKDTLREAEYGAIVSKATVTVDIFPKLVTSVFSKLGDSSDSEKISIQHHTLKNNRLSNIASDLDQGIDLENNVKESRAQDVHNLQMDMNSIADEDHISDNEVESMNMPMDQSLVNEECEDESSVTTPENNESSSKANVKDDNITENKVDSKDDSVPEEHMQLQSAEEVLAESTDQAAQIERDPLIVKEDEVSKAFREYITEKGESIVKTGESILADIESRQDDVLLNFDSKMPILEFGRDANNLLVNAKEVFDQQSVRDLIKDDTDTIFLENTKKTVLKTLNDGILRLYDTQLQSLREYFGRKYENVIEKLDDEDEGIDMDEEVFNKRRKQKDEILVEEAKKTTEGFLTAATNAVPIIIQNGELKEFASAYSYEKALDGLIRDMMHASTSSQNNDAEWASATVDSDGEGEDDTLTSQSRRRGPVKWYEKIAARALVFGVNYAQGWLAYQGIKKAAAERDRLQPKFPLF